MKYKGKYQNLAIELNQLIPQHRFIVNPNKNKQLERFNKAVVAYNDLYTTGLYNKRQSFTHIFKVRSTDYEISRGVFKDELYDIIEPVMDTIIIMAAKEQSLI